MSFIDEFRNKSEEERALDSGKPLPGYNTSRFLARNFLSIIFACYAVFVSEAILEFCTIVGVAVVIDLLRKRYVPELSESCEELWGRFERESEKPGFHTTIGLRNRPHAIFLVTVWGYYILVIVIHDIYGPEAMSGYFSFFEFLPEFASHFSRMQENLTVGLINVGYPHMVPLTAHVYSVAHAGTILWIISVTFFGNMKTVGAIFNPDFIKSRGTNWKVFKKQIIVLLVIGVFAALVPQIIMFDIDCDSYSLNICRSESNYYGYMFVNIMSFFFIFSFAYSSLLISMLITSPSSYGSRRNQNEEP